MKVSSPCQAICRLEDGVCIGCGRLTHEIVNWARLSEVDRLNFMNHAAERLKNMVSKNQSPKDLPEPKIA